MRIVHTMAPAPTAKGLRIAIRGACNGLNPASRPALGDDHNSVLVQHDVLLDRLALDVQFVGWEVRVWMGDRQANYESRVPTGCSIQWSLRRSSHFLKESRQQHPYNARQHRDPLRARIRGKALLDSMRRPEDDLFEGLVGPAPRRLNLLTVHQALPHADTPVTVCCSRHAPSSPSGKTSRPCH